MHDHLEYYSECSVHAFSWHDVFADLYYQPRNQALGSGRAVDSGRTTFFVLIVVLQHSWSFERCVHHSLLSRALLLRADSDVRPFLPYSFSRSKYYIFTIVMDVFILIQAWVLLQGTIKYSIWSVGSDVMHTCYLLVMIFGWVFSPIYWAVFITCEVVFRFRVRHFESMKLVDPSADPSRVPTCCCAPQPGEEDCCACCDVCCSGMSMNVGRSRYNNSCCCDGCCNCCIDCCVQFCGETNGPLPPGLQNEDIVYGPNGNRMIYMPNNSLPVVNPVVNPVVTPVVTPIVTPVYPINPAVQPNPDMIPMAIPVNPPTPGYTPVGVYPSMAAPVEVSPVYVTPVTMPNQPMGYPAGAVPLPANYANNPF